MKQVQFVHVLLNRIPIYGICIFWLFQPKICELEFALLHYRYCVVDQQMGIFKNGMSSLIFLLI